MNYTYRFLEAGDFSQFIKLHKTKNTFMNHPLTEADKKEYIDRLAWLFFQPDYRVSGCFLEDRLVAVSAARYFRNKMAACSHGQCFNIEYNGFNHFSLYAEVFYNILRLLTTQAESLGIFQMYMARELSEGLAMARYYKRLVEKNVYTSADIRYIYMLDKIYKKGDVEILEPHEFFFRPDNKVKRDTLISLLTLKPEFREELIRKDQQP